MPRDERPLAPRTTRRGFLRALALSTAAAGGAAAGCTGPQDVPHGRSPLAPEPAATAPPTPPDPPAPSAPAVPLARAPGLAALRELRLADGIEPATVFVAAAVEP
jgi:hypothetical protein